MICWTIELHAPRDSVTVPDATVSGVFSGSIDGEGLGEEGGVGAPDAVVGT